MTIELLTDVPEATVRSVFHACGVDERYVFALIGEPSLDGCQQGYCLPRFLLDFDQQPCLVERMNLEWDAAVVLSSRTAALWKSYPAYFVHVLAHELGHARIALEDPDLHVYSAFLEQNRRILWEGTEVLPCHLPVEEVLDAFARHTAETLCGGRWLEDVNGLLSAPPPGVSVPRLTHMLTLTPTADLSTARMRTRERCVGVRDMAERLWQISLSRTTPERSSLATFAQPIRELLS